MVIISIYGTIATQHITISYHVAHPGFALTLAVPSTSILRAFAVSSNLVAERVAPNGISASMMDQWLMYAALLRWSGDSGCS